MSFCKRTHQKNIKLSLRHQYQTPQWWDDANKSYKSLYRSDKTKLFHVHGISWPRLHSQRRWMVGIKGRMHSPYWVPQGPNEAYLRDKGGRGFFLFQYPSTNNVTEAIFEYPSLTWEKMLQRAIIGHLYDLSIRSKMTLMLSFHISGMRWKFQNRDINCTGVSYIRHTQMPL